jgi:DNA-binding MarR family transcriptional regulator
MKRNLTFKINALTISIDSMANEILKSKFHIDYSEYLMLVGLSVLKEASQKDLVSFSSLSKGMVSRLINRLIDRKLATTRDSNLDKRISKVTLTNSGEKLETTASTMLEDIFRTEVLKKVTKEEVDKFEGTIDKLLENLVRR